MWFCVPVPFGFLSEIILKFFQCDSGSLQILNDNRAGAPQAGNLAILWRCKTQQYISRGPMSFGAFDFSANVLFSWTHSRFRTGRQTLVSMSEKLVRARLYIEPRSVSVQYRLFLTNLLGTGRRPSLLRRGNMQILKHVNMNETNDPKPFKLVWPSGL